jgi:ATP-dependent DNA helicase RecQ
VDQKKIVRWLEAAVGAELLRASDDVYRTLSLTRQGRDVMAGRSTEAELTLPAPPRPKLPRGKKPRGKPVVDPSPEGADHALLAVLRQWRRREASERAIPPYVVFHDRTLLAIAALRPRSLEALAEVPGIGPAKLAAYGKALLTLISAR